MRSLPFLFVFVFNIIYSVWLWMVVNMRFSRPEYMFATKDLLIWAFIVIVSVSAMRARSMFERSCIEGALIYISVVYAISIANHLNWLAVDPHYQLIIINLLTVAFGLMILRNGSKYKLFND